jgi:hypothetical protein
MNPMSLYLILAPSRTITLFTLVSFINFFTLVPLNNSFWLVTLQSILTMIILHNMYTLPRNLAYQFSRCYCSLQLWRVHEIKCTDLASRIHGLFIT